MATTTDVVGHMANVMRAVSKEKVIRVCLACVRNMVEKTQNMAEKPDACQQLIEGNAMKLLSVLASRKWSDEEVKEDIDTIYDVLAQNVVVLSSLEMYSNELNQGALEWSPVHKSETFWRENALKIVPAGGSSTDGSGDLQLLIKLLFDLSLTEDLDPAEQTTLEVVCHDLGEFSRFHPQGKRILQSDAETNKARYQNDMSTKDKIMKLMSNPPSEGVGKQALTCIHKMMVTNWQFLEGPAKGR
jgi:V-type H+-transporting ATPase subunit H